MEQKFTKQPRAMGVVEVTLEPGEIERHLTAAAKKLAANVAFPGFRPGQAPRNLVEERFGAAKVLEEAAPAIVTATLPEALDALDLEMVGEPKVEVTKLAPGNPFVYRATISVLPYVTLPRDLTLKSRHKEGAVADGALDAALLDLQRLRATEHPVTRAATKGDKVEVDVDVSVDRVPVEGGQSRNHPIHIGEGNFIPGFEDNLIGINPGETREFQLTFPKDYRAKNLQGKRGEFKVKANRVLEVRLPALDDAFAKTVGKFERFEVLKAKLLENLQEEAVTKSRQRFELALIDEVLKQAKFTELPQILLDDELGKMLNKLRADIERQGMKWEDYLGSMRKTEEDLKKELTPQAEKRVKVALTLRNLAIRENLSVPEEKVEQEMQAFAMRVGPTPELAAQIRSGDFRRFVKNTLLTTVVLDWLKKHAADA